LFFYFFIKICIKDDRLMKVKVIPTVKVIPNSQNHRITESSGLEGTSLGHLVQLSKKKPQKLLKHVKNVTHNFL